MYKNETFEIADRREMLRVKAKSLAAEISIIKVEETRQRGYSTSQAARRKAARTFGPLAQELRKHRAGLYVGLRAQARDTHIAYGLLRGRNFVEMEQFSWLAPNWSAIEKMLQKYGRVGDSLPVVAAIVQCAKSDWEALNKQGRADRESKVRAPQATKPAKRTRVEWEAHRVEETAAMF